MAAVIILSAVIVGVVILYEVPQDKAHRKNEYDFLKDAEEKTEPQDEPELPDEETELEDE